VNDKSEPERGTQIMVQKADLPLRNDESVAEFTQKLDRAMTEHFKGLELPKKPRHLWINEVYTDRAVASICWVSKEDEMSEPSTNYQLSYSRANNGAFSFGDATEVERKTTWSKQQTVKKSVDDDFWKGAV